MILIETRVADASRSTHWGIERSWRSWYTPHLEWRWAMVLIGSSR